jgi:hypothetical protein
VKGGVTEKFFIREAAHEAPTECNAPQRGTRSGGAIWNSPSEQTAEKRKTLNKNARHILCWAADSDGLYRRILRSAYPFAGWFRNESRFVGGVRKCAPLYTDLVAFFAEFGYKVPLVLLFLGGIR